MTRLSLDRKPSIFVFDRNRKIEVFISFQAAIKIIKILNDSDFLIKDREDLIVFFCLGKKSRRVRDVHSVAMQIIEHIAKKNEHEKTEKNKKIFDFSADSDMLYASFRQAYGIDLLRDEISWDEFLALFSALPEDTIMRQVLQIRSMEIPAPTKYNAAERARIIRNKAIFALDLPEDEKNKQFANALNRMFDALAKSATKGG